MIYLGNKRFWLLILLLISAGLVVMTGEKARDFGAEVGLASKGKVELVRTFEVEERGLVGLIIRGKAGGRGIEEMAFGSREGLVLGDFYVNGLSLRAKYGQVLVESLISGLAWEGDRQQGHNYYVFYDPRCPAARALRASSWTSGLRLRGYGVMWVPISLGEGTGFGQKTEVMANTRRLRKIVGGHLISPYVIREESGVFFSPPSKGL